jgi:hypothetical protein
VDLTIYQSGRITTSGEIQLFAEPKEYIIRGIPDINITIPVTEYLASTNATSHSCQYYDKSAKGWLSLGCDLKPKIQNGYAYCTCDHLTDFAIGPYEETPEVVIYNATDLYGDGSDYEYIWWGCMNSWYCGAIILIFYFLMVQVLHKKDKFDVSVLFEAKAEEIKLRSPETYENTHAQREEMWELRRQYLGIAD